MREGRQAVYAGLACLASVSIQTVLGIGPSFLAVPLFLAAIVLGFLGVKRGVRTNGWLLIGLALGLALVILGLRSGALK